MEVIQQVVLRKQYRVTEITAKYYRDYAADVAAGLLGKNSLAGIFKITSL